jgi:hypothetical protein
MPEKPETYWFVRPLNALTNEQIAAELAAIGKAMEATRRAEDDPLGDYQVDWAFAKGLFRLGDKKLIKFSIIRRKELYGKEEDVTELVKKQFFAPKKPASIAKAEADLAASRKKRAK